MDSMMFGLVVVISLILSPIAVAKIEVKENTTYYDVVVAEPENLATVLKQSTTISRSGNTFYGQTRYSINWTYNANVKKGFCKVGKPRVTAIINTTLPKLDTQNSAVIEKWDTWFPNLRAHQNQHRQHAIDTAKQLDKALKKLKRQRECSQLFENATAIADSMIEASLDKDVQYDEKTRYGYSEGAWSIFEN